MITRSAALRSRLQCRIEHLSRHHPSENLKAQAHLVLSSPTDDRLRQLWLMLQLLGPELVLEDVLIDAGLGVCAAALAQENCDA